MDNLRPAINPVTMVLLHILGCAASTAPPVTTPVEPAPAEVVSSPPLPDGVSTPTLLGDAPGVLFEGSWTSVECGGRAYARNVWFGAGQEYAGIDLVAPCPKGTTCMWSGMVGYAGIWSQNGTKLLVREMGAPIGQGGPHPTTFESTTAGQLIENGCVYTRGLTVPPGYTDVEVTPRPPGTPKPSAPL